MKKLYNKISAILLSISIALAVLCGNGAVSAADENETYTFDELYAMSDEAFEAIYEEYLPYATKGVKASFAIIQSVEIDDETYVMTEFMFDCLFDSADDLSDFCARSGLEEWDHFTYLIGPARLHITELAVPEWIYEGSPYVLTDEMLSAFFEETGIPAAYIGLIRYVAADSQGYCGFELRLTFEQAEADAESVKIASIVHLLLLMNEAIDDASLEILVGETTTTAETTTTETTTEAAAVTVIGDISADGVVNLSDTIMLQKYVSGTMTLDAAALSNADVNADGDVDGADVLILLKYQVGYVRQLPDTT